MHKNALPGQKVVLPEPPKPFSFFPLLDLNSHQYPNNSFELEKRDKFALKYAGKK